MVFQHGIGGSQDLPISPPFALAGGAAAHSTFLASSKVIAIVGGHVPGVVAAHDRASKLLPRRDQLVGRLPLLVVMLGFTIGGLHLLLTV